MSSEMKIKMYKLFSYTYAFQCKISFWLREHCTNNALGGKSQMATRVESVNNVTMCYADISMRWQHLEQ